MSESLFHKPEQDYLRVSAATPNLIVGNCEANAHSILDALEKASSNLSSLVVFPELATTGYTAADAFHNIGLIKQSNNAVKAIVEATKELDVTAIFGAPILHESKLYNSAIVASDGKIAGVVPKQHLPNYNEFYEQRWFQSGANIVDQEVSIAEQSAPFASNLLFRQDDAIIGVEICEDLWAPIQPSQTMALSGANVIVNLSASNELATKNDYRRDLVRMQAARLVSAYVYCSAGPAESTGDTVFSGHNIIAENGVIRAESKILQRKAHTETVDIDLQQLQHDRVQNSSFTSLTDLPKYKTIRLNSIATPSPDLMRSINFHPFVPSDPETLAERTEQILSIQANGLATQLESANSSRVVLGLSGGLDSTLALLAAKKAMDLLNLPTKNILCVGLPAVASSARTQDNAELLAKQIGTDYQRVPIEHLTESMLSSIGHTEHEQDVTYENVQARLRTNVLMNLANKKGGLVLGTGDMSEAALGWCTFNGDHMSMYNVNAGIPKTLVRHIVKWCASQPEFAKAEPILLDILGTPISPELTSTEPGEISQSTEEIIGPYELHDFFLYHLLRWGQDFNKIGYLALEASTGKYSPQEVQKWLGVFAARFTRNQFKRESQPNSPKVGSVSLGQRADWRFPPNMSTEWLIQRK